MSTPAPTYPFGERAAALIGVRLNSVGDIDVFARSRIDLTKPMTSLFEATSFKAGTSGVTFTLTLSKPWVGLFAVEVAGWARPYEMNRAHFLGYANPFGADELEYDAERDPAIDANRQFKCTYTPDGKLVIEDSLKSDREEIEIKALDGPGYIGKVFVVIRVTAANFQPGCASLDFTGGQKVTVDGKDYTRLVLNPPNPKVSTSGWA